MAEGGITMNGDGKVFDGKLTGMVVITCVVAASGGLIFGYDIGISGGVTTMESFLAKFFPTVLRKMTNAKRNEYCVFDSQILTAFTSSLYIAGLFASLAASHVTRLVGRQATMLLGGATFLAGAALNAAAANISMLIIGRILLGLGVGFTNQATPVYLSETAPPRWRGAFNTGFEFFIGIGVVVANLINYGTARIHGWGWRLSLGLAGVPAVVMLVGTLLIADTPSSLIQRGKKEEARLALKKVRGSDANVEAELAELVAVEELSRSVNEKPLKNILQRRYRLHFVMSIAIPLFQQMTGINIVAFYAQVLFQMAALAGTLGAKAGTSGDAMLSRGSSIAVLALMCTYVAGFGWSWGPLSWLIPSEIFPMEIRSAGQSITVAVNFAVIFMLAQTFLTMLCHFKYGAFLF